MKQEVTIEASVGPDASVLVAVAATLQPPRQVPSAFVWSVVPETNEARIWITFAHEVPDLPEWAATLRKIPRVRRILLLGPLHSVVLGSEVNSEPSAQDFN